MRDKGFTLIELLVVIVLIGIVATIAVTGIISNQRRLQEDLFCDKVEFIEQGAILWGQDNESLILKDGDVTTDTDGVAVITYEVTVGNLLSSNYLKSDVDDELKIIDPRNEDVDLNTSLVKVYMKNKRIYADYVYASDEESSLCETVVNDGVTS